MSYRRSNRALAAVLLAAISGLMLAGPAAAADTPRAIPHPDSLQQDADAIHAAGAVGVLAAVTTPHGTRTVRAGVADVTTGRQVPLNAEFRIDSVTKSFVATVVLQLVGEGRLSLDDTVAHWLPGVVEGNGNDGTRITVRELLRMTSGVPDYVRDIPVLASVEGYYANRFRTYTPDQLVAMAMRHPPTFPPGTSASYSNTNYVLLGMIINRVTGHSWAHEVNERIITPLDLRHTITPGTFPFIPGPHAEAYYSFGGQTPVDTTVVNPSVIDAAGSMISDADDLSRFYRALIGGRLLPPAQLAEMQTTIAVGELAAVFPGASYGLGLGWFPLSCGGGYYGHPGGAAGSTTWDATTPDASRTIVVSVTGDPSKSAQLAINALVDQQLCQIR